MVVRPLLLVPYYYVLFFIVMFTPPVVANRNLRKLIESMSWIKAGKFQDLRDGRSTGQ